MQLLEAKVSGRDNNFHLMRMLAASMVLISHSFALALGDVKQEPWRQIWGVTPGSAAVEIFFIISGLLVTQSLMQRASARAFIRARVLRIWPALTVAVLLTVFGLGVYFTKLSMAEYFSSKQTLRHLALNLSLLWKVDFLLPGVFDANPYPSAINGSLWTLTSELRCYLWILGAWFICQYWRWRINLRGLTLLALLVFAGLHAAQLLHVTQERSEWRLLFMFFAGSALYQWRQHVLLHNGVGVFLLCVLGASLLHATVFAYVYSLSLPYLVVWLAYMASGPLKHYNRLGDYSYGMYIYAFPVQQSVAALWPGCSVEFLMAVSFGMTLMLAVLSWHWVESPALRWEKRLRAQDSA